jgi:hypothetical protein
MKLSTKISLADYQAVKNFSAVYFMLIFAIHIQENPPERDWWLGYDDFPGAGGRMPRNKGFANQVIAVGNFLRQDMALPVTAEAIMDFSQNHWKCGNGPTQNDYVAQRTAWANGVWSIYSSLVDDLAGQADDWITVAPLAAVTAGLWTNVPSLSNMANPAFVTAMIAQTGLSALQLSKMTMSATPATTRKSKHAKGMKRSKLTGTEKQYKDIFKDLTAPSYYFWPQLPARDQGQFGTCGGFGTAAIEDRRVAVDISAAPFLTSPLDIFIEGGGDADGSEPKLLMTALASKGICHESVFPYSLLADITELPALTQAAIADAVKQEAKTPAQITTVAEMRHAIATQGPIGIGVAVYDSFEDAPGGVIPIPGSQGVPDYYEGGHWICVDGYDDNMTLPGFSTLGAFRFPNSWGPDWGVNGYGWIHYSLITWKADIGETFFLEGWCNVDAITPQPAPPVPPAPPTPTGLTIVLNVGAIPNITVAGGSNQAMVNGVAKRLEDTPFLADNLGRVYVGIRDVAELLGCVVTWDEATMEVTIFRSAADSASAEYVEEFPPIGSSGKRRAR